MSSYAVDRERWGQLTFLEQMANIGAEVGRSINAKRRGQDRRADSAIERALDLFSATAEALAEKKSHRLREVLRARDEYLRLFYDGTFEDDAEKIEKYFHQFAVAATR